MERGCQFTRERKERGNRLNMRVKVPKFDEIAGDLFVVMRFLRCCGCESWKKNVKTVLERKKTEKEENNDSLEYISLLSHPSNQQHIHQILIQRTHTNLVLKVAFDSYPFHISYKPWSLPTHSDASS